MQAALGRQNSPDRAPPGEHLGLFPWNIKKGPGHRRRKGRNPCPGTALPFILAFIPSLQLPSGATSRLLHGRSAGAEVTAPTPGKFRPCFQPYLQPWAGNASPPRPPASSQNRLFLPKSPILLQRPAHPRRSPGETVPPRLYSGQSSDPHKHLFDLGVLTPPLGHLSHSINSRFTGARAHAPNPLRRPQNRSATGTSPGASQCGPPTASLPPSSPRRR